MTNFTEWDELLQRYVNSQGRVNYQAWKIESFHSLMQWLQEIGQLDEQSFPQPEQKLALWLNLYNAVAIAEVLKRYPISSIRPQFLGIPNWLAFLRFFTRPVYTFGGKHYSLNQIEHGILRQQFNEPRIHFALVCASIGCPLLRNRAYLPATVLTQLEADASRFINNPDKVYYDQRAQVLYCSKIFKWYRQDFLKVAASIPDYIRRYLNPDIPMSSNPTIKYLDYDWRLNQQM